MNKKPGPKPLPKKDKKQRVTAHFFTKKKHLKAVKKLIADSKIIVKNLNIDK